MTDYRSRLKSMLKDVEREREDILGALRLLDKIDMKDTAKAESIPPTLGRHPEIASGLKETLSEAAIRTLKTFPGKRMTTKQIHDQVAHNRLVSRGSMHTALNRLRKQGIVMRENNRGRDTFWFYPPSDVD